MPWAWTYSTMHNRMYIEFNQSIKLALAVMAFHLLMCQRVRHSRRQGGSSGVSDRSCPWMSFCMCNSLVFSLIVVTEWDKMPRSIWWDLCFQHTADLSDIMAFSVCGWVFFVCVFKNCRKSHLHTYIYPHTLEWDILISKNVNLCTSSEWVPVTVIVAEWSVLYWFPPTYSSKILRIAQV